jgi:L-2-hydroxyglutarate oxidase LhgO
LEKVDITIIGAGVVGLAIAAELAEEGKEILVIERHEHFGQETSSRNSEVIHSGIYYPKDSLKAKLCVEGNQLLYQLCASHQIPYQKIGKLIVASWNLSDQSFLLWKRQTLPRIWPVSDQNSRHRENLSGILS